MYVPNTKFMCSILWLGLSTDDEGQRRHMTKHYCVGSLVFMPNHEMSSQESRRAYGTALRGLVIHLNEIYLTLTLKVLNPYPKSVTCLVGGMLKMTHPNPKSCSKCHKMPKSNFIFGCDMLGWGYAENTPPQPENSDFQMSI